VSTFDSELRLCLGEILGEPPPDPDTETLLFFRQWLAERNLGLVPIAQPAAFSWPGRWLARVRGSDGDHAVVMFGSPSGALFDPSSAVAAGGAIEEGWLLAPLDRALDTETPYGTRVGRGVVAGLLVAPAAEAPLRSVESVLAIAGSGLEGDRYEVLDELGLPWGQARRNVVTHGVSLNPLVGRRFRIGAVECIGRRLAEPCAHLEQLSGAGLMRPLVHRAGLRADIMVGGTISLGDELVPHE
jgi:hypothetical protein